MGKNGRKLKVENDPIYNILISTLLCARCKINKKVILFEMSESYMY